jgi:hypothetical protein
MAESNQTALSESSTHATSMPALNTAAIIIEIEDRIRARQAGTSQKTLRMAAATATLFAGLIYILADYVVAEAVNEVSDAVEPRMTAMNEQIQKEWDDIRGRVDRSIASLQTNIDSRFESQLSIVDEKIN